MNKMIMTALVLVASASLFTASAAERADMRTDDDGIARG